MNSKPFDSSIPKWYIEEFAAMQALVTFPQAAAKSGVTATKRCIPKDTVATQSEENETMTTNTDAIYHLERDLTKAYYAGQTALRRKHNMDEYKPTTVREFLSMIKDGQYDEIKDKDLDRPLSDWESAYEHVSLRKAKPDEKAFKVDSDKLDDEYRATSLAVKTTTDPDATRTKTEAFRSHWVPAGHTVH